jgi:hypothetical protein
VVNIFYLADKGDKATRAVNQDSLNPDTDPDPIWIQGFDDQKLKKKIQMKHSFDQKLQFTYVQAAGVAFNPKKRTSSTSKNKIY